MGKLIRLGEDRTEIESYDAGKSVQPIQVKYACCLQTRRAESPLHLALRLNCIDIARSILEAPSFDILLSDSRQPAQVRLEYSHLSGLCCDAVYNVMPIN